MTVLSREQAFDLMLTVAPMDWWRFVLCSVCNSPRGDPCRKGGWSWPEPARRPHKARYQDGLGLHAVVWLLDAGHAADVLGELVHDRLVELARPGPMMRLDPGGWTP